MQKIVFFDIDGTLFNPTFFLDNFYKNLSENFDLGEGFYDKLQEIYEQTRNKNGYFIPDLFLEQIIARFPQVILDKLHEIFWNIDLFEKSMYKDASIVRDLANQAVIGIFSKGEKKFQKQKLLFIQDLLADGNIYILPNKLERMKDVFGKYSNYKIYFVDNDTNLLSQAKSSTQNLVAVLIDRNGNQEDKQDIIIIKDLSELKRIL